MAQGFGDGDRRLLEDRAGALYERAVDAGYLDRSDPDLRPDGQDHAAFTLLLDLGLLVPDVDGLGVAPADPGTVHASVVSPLSQRGAELLEESARWSEALGRLAQVYRRSPAVSGRMMTEIHGGDQINAFLDGALAECTWELLTAQPHGGRSPEVLARAADRDIRALERGVAMRTLYQHSARHSVATRDYVTRVGAAGAEVRTLDEFFNRLIVIDRRVAVIPVDLTSDRAALAIHNQSLIGYLVDIFDRFWERARPYTSTDAATAKDIAEDVREMTLRMLMEGHSDQASATRMGVSRRTFAAYVAALKEEYGAMSRFQLGVKMGRGESGRGDLGALADELTER